MYKRHFANEEEWEAALQTCLKSSYSGKNGKMSVVESVLSDIETCSHFKEKSTEWQSSDVFLFIWSWRMLFIEI